MAEYTLIDNVTGDKHDLDMMHMSDIQWAVRSYLDKLRGKHLMPNCKCMEETYEIVRNVRVSLTDY